MNLYSLEQLQTKLTNNLDAVYVLCGDEPWQLTTASNVITKHYAEFTNTASMVVTPGFNWQQLLDLKNNLGLFTQKQLIKLTITNDKLDKVGRDILTQWATSPPSATILIITITHYLSRALQSSKWFAAITNGHLTFIAKQLAIAKMPSWIKTQCNKLNINISHDAITTLIKFTTGNLLATSQTISKLAMLQQDVDVATIHEIVADSAQFSIFDFINSSPNNTSRILTKLQATKVEPTLVLWAIVQEIRKEKLFKLLPLAQRIDLIIKGVLPGDAWQNLLQLHLSRGKYATA